MKLVPVNNNFGARLFRNMSDDTSKDSSFTDEKLEKAIETDIQEKDNQDILDIDLPGYEKEDIKVQLKDGYLIITAQKNKISEDKDEEGNYTRREIYSGKCSRSLYVGDNVKEEDIKVNFNNGVLQLTFPKQVDENDNDIKNITID